MDLKEKQLRVRKMEYEMSYFLTSLKNRRLYEVGKNRDRRRNVLLYKEEIKLASVKLDELRVEYFKVADCKKDEIKNIGIKLNRRKMYLLKEIEKIGMFLEGYIETVKHINKIEIKHICFINSMLANLKKHLKEVI